MAESPANDAPYRLLDGVTFGAEKSLSDLDPAAQDGQANDLLNAFDFTQKPLEPLVLKTRTCN